MEKAVSCGGVVIYRNKILLLYKNFRNRYEGWVLPKGTVELGETHKETALREVKEETGVSAKINEYVGKSEYTFNIPGDIVEKDKDFYLAVDRHIYEYLKDHLSMIKRSKVKFVEWDEEIEVKNDYLVKSFIVSSFRLDKIISSFYKISRQKAAEFIRAGHVKVNHKPVEQINYLCNNKDIISFKKHGRVMFVDCNKQTRSDNYVVEGYFYK